MHRPFTPLFALLVGLSALPGLPSLANDSPDGSSTTAAAAPVTYASAKAAVESANYAGAVPMLLSLTAADPKNADAWNLLGFSYRQMGQLQSSNAAYLKVLAINPNHLGALEYQGELFVTEGRIKEAQANFARLQSLCGTCEEAEDLEKVLKAAGA